MMAKLSSPVSLVPVHGSKTEPGLLHAVFRQTMLHIQLTESRDSDDHPNFTAFCVETGMVQTSPQPEKAVDALLVLIMRQRPNIAPLPDNLNEGGINY